MSEKLLKSDDERRLALALLKVGGAVVTAATLTTASVWAGRRLKFEHAAEKFKDDLLYLESEAVEHHHAIVRRVAAASLLMPDGATKTKIRGLANRDKPHGPVGEALHILCKRQVLESFEVDKETQFRPTQDFLKTLVDGGVETPKLLAAAQGIYEGFSYERLREYIAEPDVLDMKPLRASDNS